MVVAYEDVNVQSSPMLFCVDVLITQYFQNSPLTEIEDCLGKYCDVSSYNDLYSY